MKTAEAADVLVLPGLGVDARPVDTSDPNWYAASHWAALQHFVEQKGLSLLVTTVTESIPATGKRRRSLLIMQPQQSPQLHAQIHASLLNAGTGAEPIFLDLPNARVGMVMGRDALFPETVTHLAKSGLDVLLIPSAVGVAETSHDVNAPNYFWDVAALRRLWNTRSNHVVHLAASDWTGNGVVIENTYGIIGRREVVDAGAQMKVLDVNSSTVRTKYLNAYYPFDLETLLGSN